MGCMPCCPTTRTPGTAWWSSPWGPPIRWLSLIHILLALVWSVGVVGMILTITKLSIPRWLTSAIYLFMGWLAIFAIGPIHSALSSRSFFWLMAGAAMYTVGGVLYAVKWPGRDNPRFGCHEIFHVFILLGSICHFVMMYQLL